MDTAAVVEPADPEPSSVTAAPKDASGTEDPAVSTQRSIREAMQRSIDVLEMADKPPKACHCNCKLAPDGKGCISQFSDTEIETIRYVCHLNN